MDDTAKGVTIGLLVLLLFHGSLESRARRASERQMREAFPSGGVVRAVVHSQPPFGLYANDINTLDLYGNGVSSDPLPFVQTPRSGIKGHIRRLRLHLVDSMLKGLPISRLYAEIPHVTYDIGWAVNKNRLLIRGAGTGSIEVAISKGTIEAYALKKYQRTISDVTIELNNNTLLMDGHLLILGAKARFTLAGALVTRDGRYVDIVATSVRLNGATMDSASTQRFLNNINPILDVDRDFQLGEYVRFTRVGARDQSIIIDGIATIPYAKRVGEHDSRDTNRTAEDAQDQ